MLSSRRPGNEGVRSPPDRPRGVTFLQSPRGEGVNVKTVCGFCWTIRFDLFGSLPSLLICIVERIDDLSAAINRSFGGVGVIAFL